MLEKFDRYPLTFGPTPIEKLPRLSAHLGDEVELYAKREDCNSGLAFGGNKLRKLEYIIPDAIASNADTLVSIGGVQSNHTRQVAAVAAKIGMKCRLVQEACRPCGNCLRRQLCALGRRLTGVSTFFGCDKACVDPVAAHVGSLGGGWVRSEAALTPEPPLSSARRRRH